MEQHFLEHWKNTCMSLIQYTCPSRVCHVIFFRLFKRLFLQIQITIKLNSLHPSPSQDFPYFTPKKCHYFLTFSFPLTRLLNLNTCSLVSFHLLLKRRKKKVLRWRRLWCWLQLSPCSHELFATITITNNITCPNLHVNQTSSRREHSFHHHVLVS